MGLYLKTQVFTGLCLMALMGTAMAKTDGTEEAFNKELWPCGDSGKATLSDKQNGRNCTPSFVCAQEAFKKYPNCMDLAAKKWLALYMKANFKERWSNIKDIPDNLLGSVFSGSEYRASYQRDMGKAFEKLELDLAGQGEADVVATLGQLIQGKQLLPPKSVKVSVLTDKITEILEKLSGVKKLHLTSSNNIKLENPVDLKHLSLYVGFDVEADLPEVLSKTNIQNVIVDPVIMRQSASMIRGERHDDPLYLGSFFKALGDGKPIIQNLGFDVDGVLQQWVDFKSMEAAQALVGIFDKAAIGTLDLKNSKFGKRAQQFIRNAGKNKGIDGKDVKVLF